MLETDIEKNDEKIHEKTREINRIKKTIFTRRQNARDHRQHSLRLFELKNVKTEIRNIMNSLKQMISRIEVVEEQVEQEIRELNGKNKILPTGNPFDFTEYLEKQKEEK